MNPLHFQQRPLGQQRLAMAEKKGQQRVPHQHLTGFQWVPVENPFRCRSVTVGGFLEHGTSLVGVHRHAIDFLLVNKFHCAEEYIFAMPFQPLSISYREIRWLWLLLLILIMLVVHGHGWGKHLGTCLVQHQCVLCTVAFAACVNADKCSIMFLISLHWLSTGIDKARALVHACATAVCLVCSGFCCMRQCW